MPEYLLPDVGEGLTEAEIVTWKVKVGDTVEINDIVVEIETAKSLVELPSPYAGDGLGDPGARGRDRRRRHADHRDRRPTRPPSAGRAGRARRAEHGDRPVQPRGARGRRRGREPGRPDARPTGARRRRARKVALRRTRRRPTIQAQASFETGLASPDGGGRRAGARRAGAQPAARRAARARRASACWPSRRCASWPRTSASTWPPSTADRPRRHDHPRATSRPPRLAHRRGCRRPAARRRRPRAADGERETREPIKGVRKMMAGRWCSRRSPRPTSPSG